MHLPALRAALTAALLAAFPAAAQRPEVGPPLRIDVGGGTAASNETTAAASEANPLEIVAAWNDWRESTFEEVIRVGVALSLDGGETWEDFLVRPPAPFQSGVEGDPFTAADPRTGALWVGGISFSFNGGIFVARKDPGAAEFEPAVMARAAGGTDKPWMTAGPLPDQPESTRLYIAYNEGLIWSDDMGETWTDPLSLGTGLGFLPRVGPNGEIYVVYWHAQTNEFRLQRSLDGGSNFTTHTIATRMDTWGIETFNSRFPGTFRVPPLVYLAVNQATGLLYAVFFDTTDIDAGQFNVDLYFTRSSDRGENWSTPTVLNGDGDPPGDQFFPWIEIDAEGRLHVVFLDSRHTDQPDGTVNGMFDAYHAYSESGGQWTETRLSPVSWNSDDDGLDRPAQFIGDYLGLAAAGGRIYPIYLDTSGGDTDVYTNVIEFPAPIDPDVNGDGAVNVQDIIDLILNWGPCPGDPAPCPADTNGDGSVDVVDLVNVILAF